MKKTLTIILTSILLISLIGCNSLKDDVFVDNEDINVNNNNNSVDTSTDFAHTEPPQKDTITVRSLDEFTHMKDMLSCKNEEELGEYLMSVEGSTFDNRELDVNDLSNFVRIVESVPFIELIEGKITWISYSKERYVDTRKEFEVLYITTEAPNGNWFRIEYILSVSNIDNEVSTQASKLTESSPLFNGNKKVAFFTETRKAHPSGTGDMINWIASIDGVFAYIVYYTVDANQVNTNNLLTNVGITHLSVD